MQTKDQRQLNLERILAMAGEIIEKETAEMSVGKAIVVANRFAETCSSLRRKSEEEPDDR